MPRSWVCRETGPRGRQALEARRCLSGSGLACRPNLAGWPCVGRAPYYLGSATALGRNDPSMLLSFERPAFAGAREDASFCGVTDQRETWGRYTPLHGP